MTAVNLNRAIRGPVTAVPVVAGKGVRLVADTVNNRFVVEADETVLWTGSQSLASAVNITDLPESLQNFEFVRIHYKGYTTHNEQATCLSSTATGTNNEGCTLLMPYLGGSGTIRFNVAFMVFNGTTLSIQNPTMVYIKSGSAVSGQSCNAIMTKVVGVNRISGGN